MSWKLARYELTGDAPLIVKGSQMADPLNAFSKELKTISSKKNKVEADHQEMGRIEFAGALYMHPDLGPVLPGDNLVAGIIEGAKKSKEGPLAKSAVFAANPGYFAIQYDGPRTLDELFEDTTARPTPKSEGFRFTCPVVRNRNRVISTRPIFHDWSAIVDLMYESSIINLSQLTRWLEKTGALVGLCEWRPRFGRFTVKALAAPDGDDVNETPAANPAKQAKKAKGKSLVRS